MYQGTYPHNLSDILFRGTTVTRTTPPSNLGGDAPVPSIPPTSSDLQPHGGEDRTASNAPPHERTSPVNLPGRGRGSRKDVTEETSAAPPGGSLPRGIKSLLSLQKEDIEAVSSHEGQGKQYAFAHHALNQQPLIKQADTPLLLQVSDPRPRSPPRCAMP